MKRFSQNLNMTLLFGKKIMKQEPVQQAFADTSLDVLAAETGTQKLTT